MKDSRLVRGRSGLAALAAIAALCIACAPAPSSPGGSGGNPGSGGTGVIPSGGGPGAGGSLPGSGGQGGVGTGGSGLGGGGVGASGGMATTDIVTRTASTYSFQHYPILVDSSGVWNGEVTPGTVPTTTTFDTVILENGYLEVTLLPEYGGRILSIVHKPTNTELLYQNPMGTPYLMQEGIFYYDYLVILGGIFPSFPEPEHGKYWNQPYEFEVLSESSEAITVRMSRQDDLELATGVPSKYDVGRTDLLVQLEVTLRAGRSSLELETSLINTGESAIPAFEYWTVTTLAPGSVPGDTKIPEATRILADMDQVHCLESSWPWFADAETRIDGEVFEWDDLSYFENWVDQGTAFANPKYDANWSGLINYENDYGIVHFSEGAETPGLKLWTFGTQSLTADLSDSTQWLRPAIEMWHGVTPEFWNRGALAAAMGRSWRDYFFPTLGLREVTAAGQFGAVYLSRNDGGEGSELTALATLNFPGQSVDVVLKLDGEVLGGESIVVSPTQPMEFAIIRHNDLIAPGSILSVEYSQNQEVRLSAQITLE